MSSSSSSSSDSGPLKTTTTPRSSMNDLTSGVVGSHSTCDDSSSWSISVKTVGTELPLIQAHHHSAEPVFEIAVSPDDGVQALYDAIEQKTGLSALQQRLIYRGRLIQNSNTEQVAASSVADKDEEEKAASSSSISSMKVRDIVGLADGHTIHLVRKRGGGVPAPNTARSLVTGTLTTTTEPSHSDDASHSASSTDNGGMGATTAILTALLGLTRNSDGDGNETALAAVPPMAAAATGSLPSALRRSARSRYGRRRAHYRLTTEDIQVADPGSMEAVRQGLLTLHTMLPPAALSAQNGGQSPSPLSTPRQWYRGQWLDVRDTVNQWLEATIVDMIEPWQILPPGANALPRALPRGNSAGIVVTDRFVHTPDLEGRLHLLLEPCDEDDPAHLGDLDESLRGFRARPTNEHEQLLFVHYNGWPHRWDEWIRSDSERLRPFRTRTRHSNMHATALLPAIESPYAEAPPTYIVSAEDVHDRPAMLPELARVLQSVQELIHTAAQAVLLNEEAAPPPSDQLPWVNIATSAVPASNVQVIEPGSNIEVPSDDDVDEEVAEASADGAVAAASGLFETPAPRLQRRQLEALAPLLDRLGRVLVDAAPHVAAMASNLPDTPTPALHDSTNTEQLQLSHAQPSTLGGLLSLLGRDRRRQSIATSAGVASGDATVSGQTHSTDDSASVSIDPDHVDFASSMVNTTRGETRVGPRAAMAARQQTPERELSSLLGAYLAAASLQGGDDDDDDDDDDQMQLFRNLLRGNGTGGIDIHIHAVLTSPTTGHNTNGVSAGNAAARTDAGNPSGTTGGGANDIFAAMSSRRRRNHNVRGVAIAPLPEEDDGLFADLYSADPDPVDMVRPMSLSRSHDESAAVTVARDNAAAAATNASALPSRPSLSNRRLLRGRSVHNGSSSQPSADAENRRGGILGRMFRRNQSSN